MGRKPKGRAKGPGRPSLPAGALAIALLAALAVLARPRGPVGFDDARAFADLEAMVRRGQRWYGAPGREAALGALATALEAPGVTQSRQLVEVRHPDSGLPLTLVNLVTRHHPDRGARVLVGTHWDTRLWAEEDPDPARRTQPIPGANDGSSGVALVIELGRVLAQAPLARLGVDLVLFDGEEFGRPGSDDYCQGSRAFAADLARYYPARPPEAAIVLDMVADRELGIPREALSVRHAPALVARIWDTAARLGVAEFEAGTGGGIYDDHAPLLQRGIPAALLIDYKYPPWHTHGDDLGRVDAANLGKVGRVVLEALRSLDAAPLAGP